MAMDRDRLLALLLVQRGMLLGYVHAIVGDVHLAEDVVQEAALVILKKGGSLQEESAFGPWARKVARLEAMNALRQRGKTPELLDPGMLDLMEQNWEEEAGAEQSVSALRACLEKLTPKARRLVDLRFVAGMPGNVLAARLQQPPNTVYVALSRIYRNLSQCIRKLLAH